MNISTYFATLQLRVLPQSIKAVDNQLKSMEKAFVGFNQRMSKILEIQIPALKVKKFTFDTLSLQRGAQTELNRIGRLIELPVSKLKLDEARIQNQFQNVFQRAANASRLNIRTIAGTGGGGNAYDGVGAARNFSGVTSPLNALPIGASGLAAGGALAALTMAVNSLSERMMATQARVSGSQQFGNVLEQAGGKDPASREFVKTEYLRISDKYGTTVDNESAKDFRTFVMAQMARGMTARQSTGLFETQQAAFRGAGMSREEIRRTGLQLQQVRAKTQGDREDLNTFSEAAPLLVEPIRRSWAERNKYKGNNLERDFRASTTEGNLKAVDFENGIQLFVRENAAAIQRQSDSIDAVATRLASRQFVQQQGLDQNPELIGSINERIKSEMALNEAMKPLRETAIKVDTALNKLASSFLNNVFGQGQSTREAGQRVEMLSPDKAAIDPFALTGATITPNAQPVADPLDAFYKRLFGKSPQVPTVAQMTTPAWSELREHSFKMPAVPAWPDFGKMELEMPSLPAMQGPRSRDVAPYHPEGMPELETGKSEYTNTLTTTVTVSPGAFVINTQVQDADSLAVELSPHIKDMFNQHLGDVMSGVMVQFPVKD